MTRAVAGRGVTDDTRMPLTMVASGGIDYRAVASSHPGTGVVATSDGVYRYVTPAGVRTLGHDAAELHGRARVDFVHPDDLGAIAGRNDVPDLGSVVTSIYRFRRGDGSYMWIEDRSRRVEGYEQPVFVSSLRTVEVREEQALDPRRGSSIDPLTGLASRSLLMDRMANGIRRLRTSTGVLAVICIDLDRFSMVNLSMGHEIGDRVLLNTAARLTACITIDDTLARVGGDEFVMVVEGIEDERAAVALCERLLAACRVPHRFGFEEVVTSVSAGMTATVDSRYGAEELLREANLALYRAKERGRNRYEVFDEELRTKAIGRLGTERMLRSAIAERRVVVEYQPIVDLATGRVVRTEALVRIRDQETLLLPESFLQVAAETGLLQSIDGLVRESVVKQAAAWNERLAGSGFGGVAINVTATDLEERGFADSVTRLLAARNVPAASLHLEITEHALVDGSSAVVAALGDLRRAGMMVGLDDFGTGYSSLSYLGRLPVDFVKIDKSFVEDFETAADMAAIVRAIIELAHALGMSVIAEGVETRGQLRGLVGLACDYAQGFLFAPSGPPQMVDALVFAGDHASSLATWEAT
ncbi:MAG TPA: bifunctional diguanylate cyclase/phosphodiesterase [Acidimicrobiia bacterium]|jgi:diguanylate cyclase (GGDEF)-like protein/PAS domain S-box-containing protein